MLPTEEQLMSKEHKDAENLAKSFGPAMKATFASKDYRKEPLAIRDLKECIHDTRRYEEKYRLQAIRSRRG